MGKTKKDNCHGVRHPDASAPTIVINGKKLLWQQASSALKGPVRVRIARSASKNMLCSRRIVEDHLTDEAPHYGINTGFGIFANRRISDKNLVELQENLVKSHAAGTGELFPAGVVRLMLLLKLHGLTLGYSGVRPLVAEVLSMWLNADCLPLVPSQGSVGASGDLAPLAHLTLPLIGEGKVLCRGRKMSAGLARKLCKLPRLSLHPKEGLGLLNGTQGMLAMGIAVIEQGFKILDHADLAGAIHSNIASSSSPSRSQNLGGQHSSSA